MEGSKVFRAKIDKQVERLKRFEVGDRVKNKTMGMGKITSISSQTNIHKGIKSTFLLYLVKFDDHEDVFACEGFELERIYDEPVKVQFT
jgi:hypothetical protein